MLQNKIYNLINKDKKHDIAGHIYMTGPWFYDFGECCPSDVYQGLSRFPATVTLTTVGYGDLCPVTEIGRVVSMLSSLFGVAIIALPSGVITASYLEELRDRRIEKESREKRGFLSRD